VQEPIGFPVFGVGSPPVGRTLRRYLLGEIGAAFVAGIVVFSFILFAARVVDLIEMIAARGVPGGLVLRLLVCIVPTFLEATLPMAFLLGVVVAFGRLGADGELVALRAAGISLYAMLRPVLALSLVVAAVTLALAMTARPWGHRELERTVFEIAKTRATAALRPRFFNTDFERMVVYVDRVDTGSGTLSGVMVADERSPDSRTTVFAQAGRVGANEQNGSLFLQLLDGTSVVAHEHAIDYDVTDFRSLEVQLELRTVTGTKPASDEPGTMGWQELMSERNGDDARRAVDADIEVHRRLTIASVPMLLALIGAALGAQPTRSARARGAAVSVTVILLYYALLSMAVAASRGGAVAPAVAMWLPNLLIGLAGAWMTARAARDRMLMPGMSRRAAGAAAREA